MKHQELEKEYVGDEVVRLQEGETYQKALELLTTEIEHMILTDKLQRMNERLQIKTKEFWLYIYDEFNLDEEEHFVFDPVGVVIRKPRQKAKDPIATKY